MAIKIYGNTRFGPPVAAAPSLITTNMIMNLDASNPSSYPGSGATWTDLSTNTNDATLVNGPIYTSSDGGAIIFDGVDDWGSSALAKQGSSTDSYTFGAWVNPYDVGGSSNWFLARGGYENSFYNGWSLMIYFNAGKPVAYVVTTSPSIVATPTPDGPHTVYAGGWYYIVGVWEVGVGLRIYLNGVLESTVSNTRTNLRQSNFYGWTLATPIAVSGKAHTKLGNVHIHNVALTEAQILNNFNATKARYTLGPIT